MTRCETSTSTANCAKYISRILALLARRCKGCSHRYDHRLAARNRILEWLERRRGEIVESSFAPPTSKGTSRMTIATRVLETILPIEIVPAGDGRSRARFEKMKYLRGAQQHERQQALVLCAPSFRCSAHCRGAQAAASNGPAESRYTMCARVHAP